jgi:6,7-dimethyl-8-ribityllumazine synthase
VVGRFNELITKQLLAGASDCLRRHGVAEDDIEAAWVPGAWEIPGAAPDAPHRPVRRADRARRGDPRRRRRTSTTSSGVASGVAALGAESDLPVVFGVLTTDTLEQALERAGTKAGNKGWDAALAALEMADLFAQLEERGAVKERSRARGWALQALYAWESRGAPEEEMVSVLCELSEELRISPRNRAYAEVLVRLVGRQPASRSTASSSGTSRTGAAGGSR